MGKGSETKKRESVKFGKFEVKEIRRTFEKISKIQKEKSYRIS